MLKSGLKIIWQFTLPSKYLKPFPYDPIPTCPILHSISLIHIGYCPWDFNWITTCAAFWLWVVSRPTGNYCVCVCVFFLLPPQSGTESSPGGNHSLSQTLPLETVGIRSAYPHLHLRKHKTWNQHSRSKHLIVYIPKKSKNVLACFTIFLLWMGTFNLNRIISIA